jgi:hypothetical protein
VLRRIDEGDLDTIRKHGGGKIDLTLSDLIRDALCLESLDELQSGSGTSRRLKKIALDFCGI